MVYIYYLVPSSDFFTRDADNNKSLGDSGILNSYSIYVQCTLMFWSPVSITHFMKQKRHHSPSSIAHRISFHTFQNLVFHILTRRNFPIFAKCFS